MTQDETVFRIQPTRVDPPSDKLINLVAEITSAVERLGAGLHPQTAKSLAKLVLIMNCYYTNLIEGHKTKPRDIERAMANDFDEDKTIAVRQFEAKRHMEMQIVIDHSVEGFHGLNNRNVSERIFVMLWHKLFYQNCPPEMLLFKSPSQEFFMTPGQFRKAGEPDVSVGHHLPPSSAVVEEFMVGFEKQFDFRNLNRAQKIILIPAAHHRFNYIHPFHDGNGRVSRMLSHAMAHHAGIAAHGLWSVSRGLARGLKSRTEYKAMMMQADTPRQGDLDGRGNLSQKALLSFSEWFLETILDQITYMTTQFDLSNLTQRLKKYVEAKNLPPESFNLLERALLFGEFPRGEATRLIGKSERTARTQLAALLKLGIMKSDTDKSSVYLNFNADSVEILFPHLFLET